MVQGDDSLNSTAVLSTCSPLLSTPVCISSPKDANEEPINHSCRSSGFLDDGTRYYVYPMVFYCDDFNPYSSMFPRGSVGGCYMQPANFTLRERRRQSSIRTISLTPAGVSTNLVLNEIIPDLTDGMVNGVQATDA